MVTKIPYVKNVLITGGTSGLGLQLVKVFLSEGCEVYATGRDPKRLPLPNEKLHFIALDFSDLGAVSATFNEPPLHSTEFDLIINNAGIFSPPAFTTTKDDFEYTFQVNFLSHLLLDELIIKNTNDKTDLLVVSVGSPVYKYIKPDFKMSDVEGYRPFKVYSGSKLYLFLTGEYLRNKFPEKKLKCIGYDPGIFSSGILRMQKKWFQGLYKIAAPFMRSPADVANKLYGILSAPTSNDGVIYNSHAGKKPMPYSESPQARELFNFCEQKLAGFLT
jgi:NAD(P)-dependent dehydrogenase (short-subunit alcohol dehydrogenase family)